MNVTVPDVVYPDENTTITIDLPKDATGDVTVTVDGKNYTVPVSNGTAVINIPPLNPGDHNITTTYSGDDKYGPETNSTIIGCVH